MQVDKVFAAIGRFAVRLRWLIIAAWIIAAIAAVTGLPSLSSVTQNNNAKFLPASAPSEHAAQLSAPFGTAGLQPIPLIAARSSGPLTPADSAALTTLAARLPSVSGVSKVVNAGRSADGHAVQLIVLAQQAGGNASATTTLINDLRAKISGAGLPAGLQVHLAGALAAAVDQQKASGNTSSKLQALSLVFIIVLLVLIFRSLSLALVTVAPALISVTIAGPLVAEAAKHGLQVSPIAQLLLIVLVLGAGTDYGLFLVFRVREELRAHPEHEAAGAHHPGAHGVPGSVARDLLRARPGAREAIVRSVTRVGESVTFSAATVIAAVLTLLLASFSFYSDLGVPFAIAIAVMLVAALTLLPALLSVRLSLLAVKRSVFRAVFGRPKLLPWNIQGSGKMGIWGRVAGRIVRHPAAVLIAGVVFFGALSLAVFGYTAAGFGGNTAPPKGSDSAGRPGPADQVFPAVRGQPDHADLRVPPPGVARPGPAGLDYRPAARQQPVHAGDRAAEPGGRHADPGPVRGPARQARAGQDRAGHPAPRRQAARRGLPGLPGHGELRQRRRPDGAVPDQPAGRRSGRHAGPARHPLGAHRDAAGSGVGRRGRSRGRRRGTRPVRHQQHLQL